ncbi:MAG: hypothetical protein HQL53_07255 [Magnetococcales bacterium]|nr:hypothetical protein [Magnetococcales bacterium]
MDHALWGIYLVLGRMVLLLLGVLASLVLGGCAGDGYEGRAFTYRGDLRIGQSTREDVIRSYGQPTRTEVRGRLEVMTYLYQYTNDMGPEDTLDALSILPMVGIAVFVLQSGRERSDEVVQSEREYRHLSVILDRGGNRVRDFFYNALVDGQMQGHNQAETLLLNGISLAQMHKPEKAIPILEQSVAADPRNHRALNALGKVMIDQGVNVPRGVEMAKRAVELFPESPYNNGTLGLGYWKMGHRESARTYLRRAISLFPVYAPEDGATLAHDRTILSWLGG